MPLELRPYQTEAVERVLARGSLLLALTMGAGKTATAITSVRRMRRLRKVDCGVVFALKSTKGQWVREINKWDPRATVQIIDGDKAWRTRGIRKAWQFNYTIMHYECLVNDWDLIKEYLPVDFMIFDEITMLKGFSAKRTRHAKALAPYSGIRIGLSGQPVENKPEELFSVMEVIDPTVLGGFHKFDKTFIVRDGWGKPVQYRNLHLMQTVLKDAMYRKSREDIKEWLPEMIEIPMPIVLDDATMDLHEFVRKDLSIAIESALAMGVKGGGFDAMAHYGRAPQTEKMQAMGQVMTRLLAMRMLSSHPLLLKLSADAFDSELSRWGSEYASTLKKSGMLDNLPTSTAKFDALLEHIEEILAEDPRHKVVIFSYFKPMLGMIGKALTDRKTPWVKITGDVPAQKRDEYIVRFNTDPKCRVFLSSDAGAYGVDLNQGSHLICYDLPWSAGALSQRVSRIDRTNSAFKTIMVGFMFGAGTIEERMFDMLQQKRKVARAFIDGDFDPRSGKLSLDLESLRDFVG